MTPTERDKTRKPSNKTSKTNTPRLRSKVRFARKVVALPLGRRRGAGGDREVAEGLLGHRAVWRGARRGLDRGPRRHAVRLGADR